MNKRIVLKSLAFVVGLYFVLEFVLPVKVGGDFDSFEVGSPAPVTIAGSTVVFYAGQYRPDLGSVGRLVADASSSNGWRRVPDGAVMQRSLFVPFDRWGMEQLDAVDTGSSLCLLYGGRNASQTRGICYSVSTDGGMTWRKRGPVLIATNAVPRPSIEAPNGDLPGPLDSFAAEWHEGKWTLWLLLTTKSHGKSVWRASGTELASLALEPAPMLAGTTIPQATTAFDACRTGQVELLYFAAGASTTAVECPAGKPPESVAPPKLASDSGDITGMRIDANAGIAWFSTRLIRTNDAPAECSPCITDLRCQALGGGAAVVVKRVGRAAMPTYLSRGTKVAGQFLQVIGSFAVFIAMINLVMFHSKKIQRRERRSYNSVIFLVFLAAMALCAFRGMPASAQGSLWRKGFDFLFNSIQVPMGSAVFSMITFFMISAAYRSFRVRSAEAALLMVAAVIVMVGQMPIGEWLAMPIPDSLRVLTFPWLAQKLLTVVNAAAFRGVLIGMLVGGFAISLRVWLGLDESVYSGMEKR